MTPRTCKTCGDLFSSAPQRPLNLFERIPGGERCLNCGRSQNWFGTAKQPTWWPAKLKTSDSGARQWRWTHWSATLALAALCLLFSISIINSFFDADSPGGTTESVYVPDMTGMNLQTAQNCLQDLGFSNLDDQPAPGEPRLQMFDMNWSVTDQNVVGYVDSTDVQIVLYAKKLGFPGGTTICP